MLATEDAELLRPDEVAAALRVSTRRVYQLAAQNRIPHVRVGPRMVRFPRRAWESWLADLNRQAEGSVAR